jgi:general secretion pathway protein G
VASALFVLMLPIGCTLGKRETDPLRRKEAILKENLYLLRNAIDQYTQDKSKAPQDLNDVVTAGYLRALPNDPFTNSNTTWQVVQEDVMQSVNRTKPGISDVHSGSNLTSSEGTAYSSW